MNMMSINTMILNNIDPDIAELAKRYTIDCVSIAAAAIFGGNGKQSVEACRTEIESKIKKEAEREHWWANQAI